MRQFFALALILFAMPAFAGNINFADGQGQWKSTQCGAAPTMPALQAKSESRADDLNGQVANRATLAAQTQSYLNCLKTEAERDAAAAANLIISAANAEMQRLQTGAVVNPTSAPVPAVSAAVPASGNDIITFPEMMPKAPNTPLPQMPMF
jgi:hypothetical protein